MSIADLSSSLSSPNPNYKTLAELSQKLKEVVLIGHSQSGHYPLETALLAPDYVKGMVLMEGACEPERFSNDEIKTLSKNPCLLYTATILKVLLNFPEEMTAGKNDLTVAKDLSTV